ncbi:MAG: aminotransferase class V-fold PLP-dependent enzyme, partial [Gammaproteobacteria bacterium]|nr:aminotransferase class V-fold PLP-dependent enzyme [Gammaproteobacteria bacterium]
MNIDNYFDLDPDIIHLNHAAVAPWPIKTVQAVIAFAEENSRSGSGRYMQWVALETELRQRLARLINAPSEDDIALLKSTSEGLSVIAYGLDWQAGDNVVIAAEEFPSNRIVWESLKPLGVEVKLVDLSATDNPEQALINSFDSRTRLLSISSVQYASGLRMQLEVLGKACQQNGILFCVDAIQHIGGLGFDVQAIEADFVVADGHKWMLGPEGLALFYCRHSLIPRLKLNQYGWHMLDDLDFDRMTDWKPADTARRFECGSPNMTGIHALHASIGLLLELGMDNIEHQVLNNVQFLINAFSSNDQIEILSETRAHRYGGIFTFRKKGTQTADLYQYLVDK